MMRLQNRLSELIVSAEIDLGDLIRFALFELSFNLNAIRMYVLFLSRFWKKFSREPLLPGVRKMGVERPIKPELRYYEVKYCCISLAWSANV